VSGRSFSLEGSEVQEKVLREVVDILSLEVFKARLDGTYNDMV